MPRAIDHLVIPARDLAAQAELYRRLGFQVGARNLQNLINLGVDHIDYQISPAVERKFMYEALVRHGSTAIPMHLALFAIPLRIACRCEIPLVIWGENGAFEYGGTEEASTAAFQGYHRALWAMDLMADFVEPATLAAEAETGRYRVVIAPWHLGGKQATCAALRRFVEAGGLLGTIFATRHEQGDSVSLLSALGSSAGIDTG